MLSKALHLDNFAKANHLIKYSSNSTHSEQKVQIRKIKGTREKMLEGSREVHLPKRDKAVAGLPLLWQSIPTFITNSISTGHNTAISWNVKSFLYLNNDTVY